MLIDEEELFNDILKKNLLNDEGRPVSPLAFKFLQEVLKGGKLKIIYEEGDYKPDEFVNFSKEELDTAEIQCLVEEEEEATREETEEVESESSLDEVEEDLGHESIAEEGREDFTFKTANHIFFSAVHPDKSLAIEVAKAKEEGESIKNGQIELP